MLVIDESLSIPDEEIRFYASRSGGPGGQNVNKVNSKVTVELDVNASPSITPEQKEKILQRLATRITNEGVLQVSSQQFRTQNANRKAATERLADLLRGALQEKKTRRKSKPSARARERRLELKRATSEKKKSRGRNVEL